MPPLKHTGDSHKTKFVAYAEPEKSLGRRILRRIFSAPVIIPLVFVGAVVFGVLF
jgi:hypothetical protein